MTFLIKPLTKSRNMSETLTLSSETRYSQTAEFIEANPISSIFCEQASTLKFSLSQTQNTQDLYLSLECKFGGTIA